LDSLVKEKQAKDQKAAVKLISEVKEEAAKKVVEKIKTEKADSPAPVAPKSETNIVAQFEQV